MTANGVVQILQAAQRAKKKAIMILDLTMMLGLLSFIKVEAAVESDLTCSQMYFYMH